MLRKFHCGDGENFLKTIRLVQLKCFPTTVNYVKIQLQFVCILWVNRSASHNYFTTVIHIPLTDGIKQNIRLSHHYADG